MMAPLLLRWYDRRRRRLPWRETRDPYRIWVSEIMLQQTRVATVLPYYEAFMARFPTVEDLAAADLDEVRARWSGLGYYKRAQRMHAAARIVAAARGVFPRTSEDLRRLPGIGPYTAAAVASMAYGEVVPVLDGNVERLLCRWLGIAEDPKKREVRERLLATATAFLDRARPGDCNQALMELGATVCTPRRPDCSSCPLRGDCRARRRGDPESYPPPRRRRRVERRHWAAVVIERRSRILLVRRREEDDLLSGLWELPTVVWSGSRETAESRLGEKYGGRWRLGRSVGKVRHSITYRSIEVRILPASRAGRFRADRRIAWMRPDELRRVGLSSMFEKVLGVYGGTPSE